jgi:RNA polymerase sigma factor (TIGR02999 family)
MSQAAEMPEPRAEGKAQATGPLFARVYNELRRMAALQLSGEKPGQTLDATALVHEAYLRLIGDNPGRRWDNRRHFFAAAAEAMRRILIDNARRKRSRKHGGHLHRRDADAADLPAPLAHEDVLDLNDALDLLAATDALAADLVQLRAFAGLTVPEAAWVLGISPRQADRLWAYARAWLFQKLHGE